MEEIKAIEEEIRTTPYNKATQKHIGKLKARLAKLKEEAKKKKRIKSRSIRKEGDATVVLVGPPSVGKSTLLNSLTNAESKVGAYDFTTLKVIPGMMHYKGAKIQLLDVPGLISGSSDGRGKGREVLSIVRNADLIAILIDIFNIHLYKVIEKELRNAGIMLNERPPDVKIKRKERGGISVRSTVDLSISEDEIKGVLEEYKVYNADVIIREDMTLERFIDSLAKNRLYIPSITILNKIDLVKNEYLREINPKFVPVSAKKGKNLEKLREEIYKKLNFIRIYTKPRWKKTDMQEPIILTKGSTISDVCDKIHKDFRKNFKFAQVWGKSVAFGGQRKGLEHVVEDGDVVRIVSG